MNSLRYGLMVFVMSLSMACGASGGSSWEPVKPGEVKPLPIGDVCKPAAFEQGVSVTVEAGRLETIPDCGGGFACVSTEDCIISYTIPYRKYKTSAIVDAVSGMVFVSEWTWLLETQNNGGKFMRMYACDRSAQESRTLDVTLKPGARMGRAGFVLPSPESGDCKTY